MNRLALPFFCLSFLLASTLAFGQSEPANHVSGFTVTATSDTEIQISWTDATGSPLPEFYLIVGRKLPGGTFAAVADGPEIPADNDWSDDNFAAIVVHGSGSTLTVSGLLPETLYEFAIYPYRENSGNANYKTTAPVPTASDFTFSTPPGGHSATFTATLSGTTNIVLAFDAASTLTDADGYVIYRRAGSAASLAGLTDGNPPPAILGASTQLVTVTNNSATGFTDTGLSGGITYHYVLVPYNYDGSNNDTYNYLTDGNEPRANATTTLVITLTQLTGGIAPSPLNSGSANQAVLGFSITTNGPVTFNALNVNVSSTPVGKFASPRLFSSADTNFDGGDISINTGSLTPTQLQFTSIGQLLTAGTYNYFVVVNVSPTVNASTPSIQPSFTEANITFTSPAASAQAATLTGLNYSFADATPSVITSTNPADNATGVSVNLNTLQIIFNEDVAYDGDNSTNDERIRLRSGGSDIEIIDPLNVSVSGNVVTFTIGTSLTAGTSYSVQIGNSVFRDLANNYFPGISNDTDWNFQTEFPPSITGYSTNPICMGEVLTITGTGFGTAPSVTINGIPVTPSSSTASSITLTVPTTTAGLATVVVTNTTNGLNDADNTLVLKEAIASALPLYATPTAPLIGENYQISIDNTQTFVNYRLRELPNPFSGGTTPGNGATVTFGTVFNKSTAGTYQYEVQATSSGCTTVVYGPLAVTIVELTANAGADQTICNGESVRLGGSPTAQGGTGYYAISWSASPPDPSLSGQANTSNPIVTPTVTTTYTVTVDDSSPATPAVDQITITVNQPADANNIQIVLTPDSTAYKVTSPPIDLSYTLSGGVTGTGVFSGPGVNSSQNKFYPGAANIGENTVTLTFTASNGCITTKTKIVNVYSQDVFLPGLRSTYCENDTDQVLYIQELPTVVFQDEAYLYNLNTSSSIPSNSGMGWDFNSTTDEITINPNILGPGSYRFKLIYRNIILCLFLPDCRYEALINFKILPLPAVNIITRSNVCINETNPEIRVNPTGGTLTVNGSSTGIIFSAGQYFLDVDESELYTSGEAPGYNTLEYSYTDDNGCQNSTTANVTIYDVPVPNFNNSPVCDGLAKEFSLNPGTVIPAGVTISRYLWEFGDNFSSTSTDVNEVILHRYQGPNNYNVTLTIETTDNCKVSTSKTVTVAPVPQVSFTWENVCHRQATQFYASTSLTDSQIASFEWNFGDGTTINLPPPRNTPLALPNTQGTLIEPLHRFTLADSATAQVFPVTFRVITNFNCERDTTVNVYKVPNITVTGTGTSPFHLSDFDGPTVQWVSGGINSSWALGMPAGTLINADASGSGKAWVTNLNGPYNINEKSWVHSPCFDLSQLTLPVLGFDRRLLTGAEDGVVLQVNTTGTTGGDVNWQVVGNVGEGLNWYNSTAILGAPGGQIAVGWEGSFAPDSAGWRKTLIALDDYLPPLGSAARKNIRFRFAFGSDGGFNEREGFAFDNFRIDKRSRVVLVEQFTNNGSSNNSPAEPNRFSNQQVNNFIGLPKTTNEIVKIEYHVGFPGPNIDRLYLDNTADASARAAYYGVTATPYTFLNALHQNGDFYNPPDPPGTSWAPGLFSQLSLEPAPVKIDTIYTINENSDGIEDSLTIVAKFSTLQNIPAGMTVHVVVVEREIDAVTGTNGETNFKYVMKKMLPNALGTRYSNVLPANFTDEVKVHWVPRAYHPDSLSVVVFVQDQSTRTVYQARFLRSLQYLPANSLVTGIENPFTSAEVQVYPNPASEQLNILLAEPASEATSVILIDMHGRAVQEFILPAGQQNITLATHHLMPGMYVLMLKAGMHTIRKKVMVVNN